MAKRVADILRNFHELPHGDSELGLIRMDIEHALRAVSFTEEEANVLRALFLIEPEPPGREPRTNRAGTQSGRPSGGTTQTLIAQIMLDQEKSQNAANIMVTRILKRACAKLAAYLGDDYQDGVTTS